MKLTPLDIHHKEFRHSIRGYAEDEVDQFLNEVAEEFERLFKENIDLAEKASALQEKVNEFELQRQTINNTLMTAQRSADDIVARAKVESDDAVAHANVKARDIVNDALAKKQAVQAELVRIKTAEQDFRAKFRALLEEKLAGISELAVDESTAAVFAEATEVAGEAPVAEPTPVGRVLESTEEMPAVGVPGAEGAPTAGAAAATFAAAPESPAAPAADAVQEAAEAPAAAAQEVAGVTRVAAAVSAVSLGELESPEVPDDVELVEPSEFQLPNLDLFGEREADDDIEEID